MIVWLLAFSSGALFAIGLFMVKAPFFQLARYTLSLLNALLDDSLEEMEKHRLVSRQLGGELLALGLFLFFFLLAIAVAAAPVWIYNYFSSDTLTTTTSFWIVFSIGATVPFLLLSVKKKKSNQDYSDWSKLLHRLVLDNYHVSKRLFQLDFRLNKKQLPPPNAEFVIVSGLARAGTTAFTHTLHGTGQFYSLSYANMPFLLAPNLWGKLNRTSRSQQKERSHKDGVFFGVNSVEALEEYFFKAHLNDHFIQEGKLVEHELEASTYHRYLDYQRMIAPKENTALTYIAKNNNFLLRYPSMRQHNPHFHFICLFRHPIDHARSLQKQHERFSKLQKDDPFVLEYMDWLGHHEFGLNHKIFQFNETTLPIGSDTSSLDYWLHVWVNYYQKVLQLVDSDRFYLVEYQDFLEQPEVLVQQLSEQINISLSTAHINTFEKNSCQRARYENELSERAISVHNQLQQLKVNPKTM